MTSMHVFSGRDRDLQDQVKRAVFSKQEFVDGAGSILKVKGTGYQDEEVPLINIGVSANFDDDENTEVFLVSSGSDTNLRFALLTIPRDKQRQWPKGTGGVQHPLDPEKAIEFNQKRTHLTDGNYAVGSGEFEVLNGQVYFRCSVSIEGDLAVGGQIIGPDPIPGPVIIPPFDP